MGSPVPRMDARSHPLIAVFLPGFSIALLQFSQFRGQLGKAKHGSRSVGDGLVVVYVDSVLYAPNFGLSEILVILEH